VSVVTIATEDLTPTEKAAIIEVCIAAHDNPDFANLFSYIPSGGRHFLAYRGDELVSHAVVTTRWSQPEGHAILKTAYVDAVSTLPGAQGQGFASTAMRTLASSIVDFEIGCLQTDKPGFYARLGWELWRGPLAGRNDDGLVPTPDQRGVMVLPVPATPDLDLNSLLTIECQPTRIWE
jgi:aminoglycoside 2'-N-acetyltransferase I